MGFLFPPCFGPSMPAATRTLLMTGATSDFAKKSFEELLVEELCERSGILNNINVVFICIYLKKVSQYLWTLSYIMLYLYRDLYSSTFDFFHIAVPLKSTPLGRTGALPQFHAGARAQHFGERSQLPAGVFAARRRVWRDGSILSR